MQLAIGTRMIRTLPMAHTKEDDNSSNLSEVDAVNLPHECILKDYSICDQCAVCTHKENFYELEALVNFDLAGASAFMTAS